MPEIELTSERGDLRMIFADAECVATPSMRRDLGEAIWAHIGPIGDFTSHPELQDALGLVCLAFNRRHGRLSAEKHAELAERDRGGKSLLVEALRPTPDLGEGELDRLVQEWDATESFTAESLYLFVEALVGAARAALSQVR